MSVEWSTRKALFVLIGSPLCTLVISLASYAWFQSYQRDLQQDSTYLIRAIVQTGPEKEALPTTYLAELMGLSVDKPANLYAFDLKQAQADLTRSPLIREASVKRMRPNALYVEYAARVPVAKLADYDNIAIDRDGYLFPLHPFFTPKKIPEIYLGLPPFGAAEDAMGRKGGRWIMPLEGRYVRLAFEMLDHLAGSAWKEGLSIERIDVSHAFELSLGQREIVLLVEDTITVGQGAKKVSGTFPKTLRLMPRHYVQQLAQFAELRKSMANDYRHALEQGGVSGRYASRIIDLRIPQLAFVENR
ncbi:MAG: hypothetical protein RL235_1144 [Chlamydiota bacterium]|jgi:hypothetical protein